MLTSPRCPRLLLSGLLLVTFGTASAQTPATAPQLLPYTSKLIAGGSYTSYAAYTATNAVPCTRTNSGGTVLSASGNNATDKYGDGCLATEISLTGPRFAIADNTTGAIFFSDYTNGLIRRIDPVTGIVTLVAGGATASPSGTTALPKACGGTDPNTTTDVFGDGCLGTSVKLGRPVGLAFSPAGDLYFADYYSYNVRKIAATNKVITGTGIITLADGSSTSATTKGFAANPSTCTPASTSTCVFAGTATSYLYSPYGVAFDTAGNLYISDEYAEAILVVNTNATGSTTIYPNAVSPNAPIVVPAGTVAKIVGAQKTTPVCTNSTTTSAGCYYTNYTTNTFAGATFLDSPYNVALDTSNNLYVADENYGSVAAINSATGNLTNAAGLYPLSAISVPEPQTKRATAGTFAIGSDFGVAADSLSNLYITDALNGYVWRVDAATQSMYVVAGGGSTPSVANNPCPNASNFVATDTFGDGCPGLQATFSDSQYSKCTANPVVTCYASGGGIFGVTVDQYADLFIGDENNNVIREIASGTQFGDVGATQTDYVSIHFAVGDGPAATNPYTITNGATIFTVGTASCTTNSDNTTDCILPITAAPTATGPFTGTLTVTSNLVPAGTPFTLNGNFVQSPVTRLAVSSNTTAVTCAGTIYATTSPVVLTAALTANGPVAPAGTITFTSTNPAFAPANPTVTVTNIGTASAPVYGATLTYTFTTAGPYNISATFTPTTGTYFHGSTSTSTLVTSSTPAITATLSSNMQSSVVPGQTALYSLNIAQNVFTGTITFGCSGLPTNASCIFYPSSITAAGCTTSSTVAFSIVTTAPPTMQSGLGLSGPGSFGLWTLLGSLPCLALALLLGIGRNGTRRRLGQLFMVLALVLTASGITACNNGVKGAAATPAGTYSITVTATGTSVSPSVVNVPLVVQ